MNRNELSGRLTEGETLMKEEKIKEFILNKETEKWNKKIKKTGKGGALVVLLLVVPFLIFLSFRKTYAGPEFADLYMIFNIIIFLVGCFISFCPMLISLMEKHTITKDISKNKFAYSIETCAKCLKNQDKYMIETKEGCFHEASEKIEVNDSILVYKLRSYDHEKIYKLEEVL